MNKLYVLLLVVMSITFVSCSECPPLTDCSKIEKCKINSDCKNEQEACYNGICDFNRCSQDVGEINCGLGVCITGSDVETEEKYTCECDEGAVLYDGLCSNSQCIFFISKINAQLIF